jgi:hypothetical protein
MSYLPRHSSRSFLLAGLLGLTALISTGVADAPRSPFSRPKVDGPAAAAPEQEQELQFIGTFGDGAAKRFCIYNIPKNRSQWLTVGQTGSDDLVVDSFDSAEKVVQVRFGSRSLTLPLQSARITAVARPAVGVPATAPGSSLTNTVKVNPTPADERARLEAVAAEVRRRRALRQSATAGQELPRGAPRPPR